MESPAEVVPCPPLLVTVREAARLLSVSETKVRHLIADLGSHGGKRRAKKARLPFVKVDGCTRIPYAAVVALASGGTE